MGVEVEHLVRATDRLVTQVGHWSPARWAGAARTGDGSRADVVHALAQRLADLEAEATGRPSRPVPRLGNDLALIDQLRVLVRDLVVAGVDAEVSAAALEAINATRQRL